MYKESIESWDKVAFLYEEKFRDIDLYNESYDFMCNSLTINHANVLEIGCGPGNITGYILSRRPNWNITGIDASPNMVGIAAKNVPQAEFRIMDARSVGDLDRTFDGIICGFCIPYLSLAATQKLISDTFTLLNPGGYLYLSFVEGDPARSGFQTGEHGNRIYFVLHEADMIEKMLFEVGFGIEKKFDVTYKKTDGETDKHIIFIVRKQPCTHKTTS